MPDRSGHTFNPLAPLNMASYAASVIDAESLRPPNEPSAAASGAFHLAKADACLRDFFRRLYNSDSEDYRGAPQDMTSKPDNTYTILIELGVSPQLHSFEKTTSGSVFRTPRST
eukprot:GFKZ01000201.1.p2 GENE.GFKZ01000201.1~~GFKZ01000201.1.p2  ORF type:complete len:114 (-),score=3.51 GFKZ01000201.1:119-460(-)